MLSYVSPMELRTKYVVHLLSFSYNITRNIDCQVGVLNSMPTHGIIVAGPTGAAQP
jgi:hypothetical protein